MKICLLILVSVALLGCGVTKDITRIAKDVVGLEDDNSVKPSDLLDFEPSISVEEIWSGRYGKGVEALYIQLIPAHEGSQVFTADRDGRVIALDLESGEELWEVRNNISRSTSCKEISTVT